MAESTQEAYGCLQSVAGVTDWIVFSKKIPPFLYFIYDKENTSASFLYPYKLVIANL